MPKKNLFFLYIMELCAGAARGAYLVCIGWTTLIVSGDVAAVGQIFIVAMITVILTGPVISVIVDRYNRKFLAIFAHLGIATTLSSLGLALAFNNDLALFWFFLTVVVVTIFRTLYQNSHDGLIHANVSAEKMIHSVARFRGLHLLATAVGTVLTGIIIEYLSVPAGFLLAAIFSIFLVLPVTFVKGVTSKENMAGFAGFLQDFAGGLALFKNYQQLRVLTLLASVALPIGQLSNAILSSFIRDDLGRGSDVFGIVDAAWPMGGMAAAAVLSLGLRNLSAPNMAYFISLLVGFATMLFAFCTTIFSLVVLHATMGFTVWMCRIVIDGRILQVCTRETVGRTKVYIDVMFSLVAMVMCFSPTLISLPSTGDYFLYWGLFIVISTSLLWLGQPRAEKQIS